MFNGMALRDQGKLAQAENALRKSVGYNSRDPECVFNLGLVLLDREKYAEAAETFRRVLEVEPSYSAAYVRLAECAQKIGDRPGAIRWLNDLLHYMPQSAEVHRQLAELLSAEGQRDEARQHLKECLRLNPNDVQARTLLEKAKAGNKTKP
jgi:tetratricopeptide (TPR) repeat protein